MTKVRQIASGALTVLALATLAACGQAGVTPQAPVAKSAMPTIMAAGEAHTLSFNYQRYENMLAKKAHIVHPRRQGVLPSTIDNRQGCAPVYDQGRLGSCTAFAIDKGFREYLQRKNGERVAPLSALWFYYNERELMGTVGQDSGATITDGMQVLTNTGAAPEELWPYDISKFTQKPPAEADQAATEFKLAAKPVQLGNLDDMKTALAAGKTVAFGFRVHKSFMKTGPDGMMPEPGGFSDPLIGGHAVLAVGYDDAKKVLIVRNSWSDKWGDHGYFYMPYSVAGGREVMDIWTSGN